LTKTVRCVVESNKRGINGDFTAGSLCGLPCTQAEQARFDLLTVLIQLIQAELSSILRNSPAASEYDDDADNQQLEKSESF
tara:strand:+ start:456 stop:698 length:243 start_codon:yes stop_codon:yes gene_type:complete